MSAIDRSIAYIAGLDPRFPSTISGASPDQIRELEHLSAEDLPQTYREFLERMGKGTAWLALRKASLSIDSVLAFYRRTPRFELPPKVLLIGVERSEPYYDLHLDWRTGAEARVVMFPHSATRTMAEIEPQYLQEIAGSLPEALCGTALRTVRLPSFPHRRFLTEKNFREGALAAVESALGRAGGFQKLWFSTATGVYFQREDAVVRATLRPATPLALEFGTATPELAEALQIEFSKLCALQPMRT